MKIFISYRRDDTAGRAGRLFDVLVTRFGARNVFQDVAAIEPGSDFTQRVDDAIAQSDAALVMIGSDWLTMRGPDGTRRLDEPDDYVRREVSAALAAGVRVVPVLVGGAELPASDDLSGSLRPLATRQAVTLRDATWHQDVDALIRRLEGEELIDSPRRRWPAVGGAAVAVVAVVLGGWIWLGDDGGGGYDDSLRECSELESSWSSIDVLEENTVRDQLDGKSIAYTVRSVQYQVQESDKTMIILRVEIVNESAPIADSDDHDVAHNADLFGPLLVDQIATAAPSCFSEVSAEMYLEPGRGAIADVGYESGEDPTGAQLVLITDGDNEIEITEPS